MALCQYRNGSLRLFLGRGSEEDPEWPIRAVTTPLLRNNNQATVTQMYLHPIRVSLDFRSEMKRGFLNAGGIGKHCEKLAAGGNSTVAA